MKNLNKNHFKLLLAWFIINLLQAIFTGLHSDESYYWMFSQNLDWGYFDHPPMAAFFIYLGNNIFPGEIGVRLLMIIISTITFALILNEINEKEDILFLTIFIFSFPLIHSHIAGFLAIPDIPLLFFTLLFLLLYKQFLKNPGWNNSILLGMIIAAMIYSKYHAFLIIGFTLFSNLRLLKNKFTYVIILVALVFLLPHILWQVNNDFPTFKYHLVERAKPFRIKYVLPYLIGVILVTGPLTGILVFWKLRKVKSNSPFQRALIFNVIGFIALFFLMSFKNRIEMHWIAAIIPMIMFLTYPLIKSDLKAKKWFTYLALPVVALMFIYRIYLALDIVPNIGNAKITFYNRESNALQIKEMAQGNTVGFYNNYAAISNYIFYTGDSAVYLSTPDYRFCQYDLWNYQQFANGSDVFAIQSKHMNPPNLAKMTTGEIKGYLLIKNFQSLKELKITVNQVERTEKEFIFSITLKNNNDFPIVTNHSSEPVLIFNQNNIELTQFLLSELVTSREIPSGNEVSFYIKVASNFININLPIQIYTRTNKNVRGEIISLKIQSFL